MINYTAATLAESIIRYMRNNTIISCIETKISLSPDSAVMHGVGDINSSAGLFTVDIPIENEASVEFEFPKDISADTKEREQYFEKVARYLVESIEGHILSQCAIKAGWELEVPNYLSGGELRSLNQFFTMQRIMPPWTLILSTWDKWDIIDRVSPSNKYQCIGTLYDFDIYSHQLVPYALSRTITTHNVAWGRGAVLLAHHPITPLPEQELDARVDYATSTDYVNDIKIGVVKTTLDDSVHIKVGMLFGTYIDSRKVVAIRIKRDALVQKIKERK